MSEIAPIIAPTTAEAVSQPLPQEQLPDPRLERIITTLQELQARRRRQPEF